LQVGLCSHISYYFIVKKQTLFRWEILQIVGTQGATGMFEKIKYFTDTADTVSLSGATENRQFEYQRQHI
jgi:hypothetical protein